MTPATIHLLEAMWGACISFLVLTFVFWPLEKLFPARDGQAYFRPDWVTDLCFFLGHYLFWNSLMFSTLMVFKGWFDSFTPALLRDAVHALPFWLQMFLALFLSDLCIYWGHRWQHNNEWLWRFHSVHHSSEHLDWLAAHREHPMDSIFTMGLINLPVFLLGFPIGALAAVGAFRGMWAIYIHSNVRLPLGPLRVLIGAPELHHWHHDRDRSAGNYANISPIMDVLFGTYRCPDHEPRAFGLGDPAPGEAPRPGHYLAHLVQPFSWPRLSPAGATSATPTQQPSPATQTSLRPEEKGAVPTSAPAPSPSFCAPQAAVETP
ncbi:MAG: sterol desaturase family protein [Candidatus Methylacidiphilales bacterium]